MSGPPDEMMVWILALAVIASMSGAIFLFLIGIGWYPALGWFMVGLYQLAELGRRLES